MKCQWTIYSWLCGQSRSLIRIHIYNILFQFWYWLSIEPPQQLRITNRINFNILTVCHFHSRFLYRICTTDSQSFNGLFVLFAIAIGIYILLLLLDFSVFVFDFPHIFYFRSFALSIPHPHSFTATTTMKMLNSIFILITLVSKLIFMGWHCSLFTVSATSETFSSFLILIIFHSIQP